MSAYRFFGRRIESSFEIPELSPATEPISAVCVQLAPAACELGAFIRDLELHDGSRWATLRRRDSKFQLEFLDGTVFAISSDGQSVICYPRPSLPVATLRHLLLNQVLPFAFAQRSEVVLHASCVAVRGCGVAFLGPSGFGKSTLAASLGQFHPIVSDDALLLSREGVEFTGIGSYADLRLWKDSVEHLLLPGSATKVLAHYSDKQRTESTAFQFELRPIRLARLYLLSPGKDVGIDPVPPAEAVISLLSPYRLDCEDYRRLGADQQFFAAIVSAGLVRRLSLRHRYSELDAVERMIREDLRSGPTSAA